MPRESVRKSSHIFREKMSMRHITIEIAAAIALTLGAIIAFATNANAADLAVTGAFARASATPVAKSAAAYVTVDNGSDEDDAITGVATPAAASAMLHKTEMSGDVMKMEHVDSVAVPAHGSVKMSPSGLHVMLMGLKAPLKEGESLRMILTFARSAPITVDVPIHGVAANE